MRVYGRMSLYVLLYTRTQDFPKGHYHFYSKYKLFEHQLINAAKGPYPRLAAEHCCIIVLAVYREVDAMRIVVAVY